MVVYVYKINILHMFILFSGQIKYLGHASLAIHYKVPVFPMQAVC